MVKYLKDAGFVDVRVLKRKQPVGIWPKDPLLKKIGAMCLLNVSITPPPPPGWKV